VKNIEIAHDAWAKLEKTFEGTEGTKTAKAYILQEKFSSFKIQEDESVPEMFHRLQVIVNELKALGEEVKDNQFSIKFLRSLPKRFDTLITVLVRTTLQDSTPQQVFQEVMTDDSYREDDEKEELVKKKKKKSEKKDDKKKKSVTFKATTSKGKSKIESSSDEDSSSCDSDDIDEKMALFVKQFSKFMKKKDFHARRRKNSSKKNEHTMRCFRCHSKDHLITKCPYDSDDEDVIKKERKKQKKKQEKKMRALIRRRMILMLLHGIVMIPQVMMRMTTRARRRDMLALPFKRRSPSSTLHRGSWLRPLRYHPMMRVIMIMLVIVIVMKKNSLKIN
jgi:hypothetical protein